jgi:hypothetical protein
MKTYALVNYITKVPVNKFAYTTAATPRLAWENFLTKRGTTNNLIFPNIREQIETSKWVIVEVPKKVEKQEQLSFKDFWNEAQIDK